MAARLSKKVGRIGYYMRRKPADVLLQDYIGAEHALFIVQQRIAEMRNPTKEEVIEFIRTYRQRIAEYAEALVPGSTKAFWPPDV